ncbi:hypothetical protein D3C84_1060650 [compost metagenome]
MTRLARALTYFVLAPVVLAVGYLVIICVFGGMWLLAGLLGDPAAMIPYAFVVLTFMLLWSGWEIRRSRILYRKYIKAQTKADLEVVVFAPAETFTKFDRKMAVTAIYEGLPKLGV